MTATITIVRAGEDHLEELVPLFTAYRQFFNPLANPEDSAPFLQARLRADECAIFLAVTGTNACGFIQLYPLWSSWYCKRIWFLSDLFVAEAHRELGAGRMLVERVKTFAKESSASSVMVELPHSQPHLTAFYEALGFHRDPVFDLARYAT